MDPSQSGVVSAVVMRCDRGREMVKVIFWVARRRAPAGGTYPAPAVCRVPCAVCRVPRRVATYPGRRRGGREEGRGFWRGAADGDCSYGEWNTPRLDFN
jgi:hypothetical protein